MQSVAARAGRLDSLRRRIERRLADLAPPASSGDRLTEAMRYALSSPGKRLRPLITLMVVDELGGEVGDALDCACAVEMVHAASLVLDDLPCMDDAAVRRGLPSTHARFGQATAVLAAVALLNEAFALVAASETIPGPARLEMVQTLTRTVGHQGLAGGQESDLRGGDASLIRLRDTHHRKTGMLFMAAATLGGLAGRATALESSALERFAAELGLAFQARDDVADAEEDPAGLIVLLGPSGAAEEVRRRAASARQALAAGGDRLRPLQAYVELLLGAPVPAVTAGAA